MGIYGTYAHNLIENQNLNEGFFDQTPSYDKDTVDKVKDLIRKNISKFPGFKISSNEKFYIKTGSSNKNKKFLTILEISAKTSKGNSEIVKDAIQNLKKLLKENNIKNVSLRNSYSPMGAKVTIDMVFKK